ncbi:uncharacterized protein LOC6573045 isoform X2 [Drosophila mojavensis]|uniref:Globin family profile domain-containing protein n=1 Tax=Drosophila mojavensis TaxID=7230 RepID=B4KAB3_DROMO|nr:uncharacterized protein LOC6573045 isoform X2 [Drosophila mojavensis]EDW14600.1 uncharacterized protein Dmoj_GI23233 [Drosophila mojavensis]
MSKISIKSNLSQDDSSSIDVTSIFPKALPEFKVGPVYDECGFTLNERLALRQAWKLIKPFERRYGKEIYFEYLMENYKVTDNFRIKGKLDMHRLHGHSLAFMRYLNAVIEQNDPVFFQNMLFDNHNIHSRCQVSLTHMKVLLEDLIQYVLEKLKDVCSASLESGFRRLLEKFQFDQPEKSNSLFKRDASDDE